KPHNGPDALNNLLCLCPNDHVRFDGGSIIVTESLEVVDTVRAWTAPLRISKQHAISGEYFAYHRELFV
ncbi:MAG: hypothetical protein JWM86_2974, partial [Thermoleophilia bacterium]|nr:hypothetical protein [Thermoleophilia bacterium]